MARVSTGVRVGGIAVGLGLALACNRHEGSVEPRASRDDCNPADDCNDMLRDSTVRQHSDRAASVAALSTGCPHPPDEVPPLESLDDRSVPEFNAGRHRVSNMERGNERLQDIDLHAHMMGMHGQLFACVDLAACYPDGAQLPGDGELDFDFELHPDGHVAAVSVRASSGLDHPSVVACARRTMVHHRFPRFDGGQMMINYQVVIEEVPGA